jgi:glucose/arabinose dehydrogenase
MESAVMIGVAFAIVSVKESGQNKVETATTRRLPSMAYYGRKETDKGVIMNSGIGYRILTLRVCAALIALIVMTGDALSQEFVDAFPNLSFSQALFLATSGDGSDRLFVVEQTGGIRVFQNDPATASSALFLDLSGRISSSSGEQGLLGLAFHPDYAQNGFFYVDYTAPNPLRTVVARYTVMANDPNRADPASEFTIIEIPQPYTNHNGGMLAFGPDGYLYIGMGDGGSGGDPDNYAQDTTQLLGKILRIDVNDTTVTTHYVIPPDNPYAQDPGSARKEIWALGFRNPWRFSFDGANGMLWVGDVGENTREEIDIVEKGKNYGWRIMEGTICHDPPSGCDQTGLELPIKDYSHLVGDAVVGGYVYHGLRRPGYAGAYIYGDYGSHRIWLLRYGSGVVAADSLITQIPYAIKSFGVDRYEELYVVTDALSGSGILRFSGGITGEDPPVPESFILDPNYPNPFGAKTSIAYTLKKRSPFSIGIYDAAGHLVRVLLDADRPAGTYSETWDGRNARGEAMASGVYFYRLEAGEFSRTRKMILLR